MVSLRTLLLPCLLALPGALSQSFTDALEILPSCAVTCLAKSIAGSVCLPTDQKCLCTNEPLQGNVTACVYQSCTIKQALFTKNVTMTTCGAPIRNRAPELITLSNVMGVVSGTLILQRFAYKIWAKLDLGADDWMVLVTIISGIPGTVINAHGTTANGLGKDIWTVPFDQITMFGKYFYIMAVLYFLQVTLLKLSLLFFYLRIFPTTPTRALLWGTVIFNSMVGVVFVVLSIFQCRPIHYFWTKWDGENKGYCLDINSISWSNAGISIALDIWMLAVPMAQLRTLNLNWRKKVGVGMMFCVGTFVTVVSVLRLQSLIKFGVNDTNPTWDFFEVTKWSTVEINVGIICACMPSLRLVLVRFFPKMFGSTQRSYGNQYYASGGSNFNKSKSRQSRIKGRQQPTSTTNPTVSVGDGSESGGEATNKGGIVYSKSFAIDYSETDETQLVHMREFDHKNSNSHAVA